jgi:uncharacterized protein
MDHFSEFSIPILGLKDGEYRYEYQLDSSFFLRFEDSPIDKANLSVDVFLDKRASMMVLDMQLTGTVAAICDRCTAAIDLPIDQQMELIVKNSETPSEDDEVVFIHPSQTHFNFARYFYEFAVISLPIVNTFDCEEQPNPPCRLDVLAKIAENSETPIDNPIWDALKQIKKD